MEKRMIIEAASNRFENSEINCAQAVVYAALLAQNKQEDVYLDIARAFGGGIGSLKETCGIITGCAIAYTMIMEPDSQQFKERIRNVADLVTQKASSTQCASIVAPYPEFVSVERKQHCNMILLAVLDYILEDFIQ